MAWPDISRKIWSYIIAKLGIFTNVDPENLEVTSNSLRLNAAKLDLSKFEIPGITLKESTVANLLVELNSFGLAICASGFDITAKINELESPDLAISKLLEKSIMENVDMNVPEEYTNMSANNSGFVAKLADMALSQITARVSDINMKLELSETKSIIINITEAYMVSKDRIEFESITFTQSDEIDVSDTEIDEGGEEEDKEEEEAGEDIMSRSIYIDAKSSIASSKLNAKQAANGDKILGIANSVTFTHKLNAPTYTIEVERVRADGFQFLETIITILNEFILGAAAATNVGSTHKSQAEESRPRILIQDLEIHESLDEATTPMTLSDICYESERLTIASLDISDIVKISPFLELDICDDALNISLLVPISISISLNQVKHIQEVCDHIVTLMNGLNTPQDAKPTPFKINLPDIRITIGFNTIINIFPNAGTEEGLSFSEITAKISDNQLVIKDANLKFPGNLEIFSLKMRLNTSFFEEIDLIKGELKFDPPDLLQSALFGTPKSPIKYELHVKHLDIAHLDEIMALKGHLKLKMCEKMTGLEAKFDVRSKILDFQVKIMANSLDELKSIESTVHFKTFCLYCDPANILKYTSKDETLDIKMEPKLPKIPDVAAKIIFDESVTVKVDDETTFHLSVAKSKLAITTSSKVFLHIPWLRLELQEPKDDEARISILKVKTLNANFSSRLFVDIAEVSCSSCADSYDFINKKCLEFLPKPKASVFRTETTETVDIFREVVHSQFTSRNLDISNKAFLTEEKTPLKITEEYIGHSEAHGNNKISNLGKSNVLEGYLDVIDIVIKRVRWYLYDGFDFQGTREKVNDTIKQVTKVAADLDNDLATNGNDTVVGEFMCNSVFITKPGLPASTLRKEIAGVLGSPVTLERSGDPKLVVMLNKTEISLRTQLPNSSKNLRSQVKFHIREFDVADHVITSRFNYVLTPARTVKKRERDFVFEVDTVGPQEIPEIRAKLHVMPLHLSLDQDTVEFIARWFQFSNDSETDIEKNTTTTTSPLINPTDNNAGLSAFIQKFEFGGLPLIIDYTPKKLDYRSLRSGITSELVNLFAVRGAKLTLQPKTLYGIDGWDQLLGNLMEIWMPDIRENQIFGLVSGIAPIRRAMKVSKGLKDYTIKPIKQKDITKGAGIVVRRTLDELLRLGSGWLDSTDEALGGA